MSGEDGINVGGARRAFAELTEPTAGLVADFGAAEDGAAELEPDLLLLDVDPLGGITLPVRAARTESERRRRRAPGSARASGRGGQAGFRGRARPQPSRGAVARWQQAAQRAIV